MPIPLQLRKMNFKIVAPESLLTTVKGIITSLFRNVGFESGPQLEVISQELDAGILTEIRLSNSKHNWQHLDQEINQSCYRATDRAKRRKERVRLGVMVVLCAQYNIPFSPWGILTGVRPVKLVHRLIDREFDLSKIRELLTNVYRVAPQQQQMLMKVALKQRPFFCADVNNPISIYVGIPFCPTRCDYCSFAAYPLKTHGHLLEGFQNALHREIAVIGRLVKDLNVKIQAVYVGGGTPTTLEGDDLHRLLHALNKWFGANQCEEYTVEAGRPETLSKQTLKMLKDYGVNRVSINPQTMNDRTLKLIGRGHSANQIREAFAVARECEIPLLNSDLILGLPGEDVADFIYSLEELTELGPDNITIHSLALKHASKFRLKLGELDLHHNVGLKMSEFATKHMHRIGFKPYYLYRQRFILSDLENVGYARNDAQSIYNIQMMEERQTIIGVGGGAVTKLVKPDLSVVRQVNPKCPATYTSQVKRSIDAKMCQISQHLLV